MIYVEMYGRLGNQFFRYAAARALQLTCYPNEHIIINFQQINDAYKNDHTFYNVLQDFNVTNYSVYSKRGKVIFNESSIGQKLICIPYYFGMRKISAEQMNEQVVYEKKWEKILMFNGLYWFRRGSYFWKSSAAKNKFISGCFEDPIYFECIRDVLIQELTPKVSVLQENANTVEKNQTLLNLIVSTNSVCISIRRGDFENNVDIRKLQSVCDKNYFEKAIEKIKTMIEHPVFFMFSDDIEWVRNNIETNSPTYYEDGTDPVWEKLRLMRSCKHFIISNSTFSWWAQYLSQYKDKIVISPERWFNNNYRSPLIGNDFVKIPI